MEFNKNDNDIANAESEFLRHGIPSIVLAITTIVLTAYSIWVVQPNIQIRYRNLCDTNLSLLGLSSLPANTKAEQTSLIVPTGREDVSPSERERLLLETHLSLRRLANIEQTSDSIRFESAMVSLALADFYRERAWEVALENSDSNDFSEYLAKERHSIGQASESMRTVQRLNGPWAVSASVWLLDRQLLSTPVMGVKELVELESSTRRLMDQATESSESPNAEFPGLSATAFSPLLARIATLRALEFDSSIKDDMRWRFLTEANAHFEAIDSRDTAYASWRALAKLPFDSDKARDWAWGDVQAFWSRGTVQRPRSEELDSVLRGLLVGGNLEEAQSFVFNQLKKLPRFEQSRFRELAAATCLRQLVANQIMSMNGREEESKNGTAQPADFKDPSNFVLLDLAVRLQPEVPGLPELLIEIATKQSEVSLTSSSSLADFVHQVIELSSREGFNGLLETIRMAETGNSEGVAKGMAMVLQDDIAYGVLSTKVAMTLANAGSSGLASSSTSLPKIDHGILIEWLREINDGSPDILSAWFARGSLHLNAKEFDQAIECLDYLSKRVPDSEQVQEMLETARMR